MSKEIKEYDENNNLIYIENFSGFEEWYKYDENNNLIYSKYFNGLEYWQKYDENNKIIYSKDSDGDECWCKWENNKSIEITEKEYNEIEFRKKEKEYNSRTKCSRFEIMEI